MLPGRTSPRHGPAPIDDSEMPLQPGLYGLPAELQLRVLSFLDISDLLSASRVWSCAEQTRENSSADRRRRRAT